MTNLNSLLTGKQTAAKAAVSAPAYQKPGLVPYINTTVILLFISVSSKYVQLQVPDYDVTHKSRRQFRELVHEATSAQVNTYAKGSRKNLRSGIKTFLIFCIKFGRPI
jgi:hypothetical protein